MMHVDNVALQTNGNMVITLTELLNAAVAAGFSGGTVAGTIAVDAAGSGYTTITITVTVTPAAPVAEPVVVTDPGGSASIDG